MLDCVKQNIKSPDRMGVFTNCSPLRHKQICLTVAQGLEVDEARGRLVPACLDAENGTDILIASAM